MKIIHKCPEWKGDIKIHPEIDILWGTHLEYCENVKQGEKLINFWALMDKSSETFSIYRATNCCFCGIKLESLI